MPPLITISASGDGATVERALCIAADLVAAGLNVQVLAFDDFSALINDAGIRFCSAPGDLAGFEACPQGSVAAMKYLASAVPGMPMTLDGRLRDSTMIVLCDDSPLIPSIAEARGLPIFCVPGPVSQARLEGTGVKGWLSSVRTWHAVRASVNDMRMFLGMPDFSSPRSFRRSITRLPVFTLDAIASAKPRDTPAVAVPKSLPLRHRLSA